jgi:hypothetical protein
MKFLRETAVVAEAVCDDDKPKTGKLGVGHEVLVGCHNMISFLMTEIGHSLAKRGETVPSLTPDLLE